MAERSALTQGVQIGLESTPGTSVAANKQLLSVGFEPSVSVDMKQYAPMGSKYNTIVVPGKEWVEGDLTGVGSYTDLLYPLNSCLVAASAPSTVDTTGKTWTFTPAQSAEDTVKTYTVEVGGAVRAHKFTYCLVTSLELTLNRDGVEIGGSFIGQRITDGIVLTGSPTSLPQVPILPTEIDVWLDTTSGGLGTTKLTRVLEATITVGDRFNPVWVLNSANNSFVAHVETKPSAQIKLLVEADTAGMAMLADMRAGTTKFMRIKCTSSTLAGASTAYYSLQWDAAVKVSDVGEFSDEDGVYAIEWTFDMVYDATWTKAYMVTLVNKEATL